MILSPEAVVQRCSVKKVLLEISQNSQENNQRLFFNKVAGLRPVNFPVNFVKFLRTRFFKEHLLRLLLYLSLFIHILKLAS